MIHAAIFHPTLTQRVEGVRVYGSQSEVPQEAVVVSNWGSVDPAPFEGAEMRQSGGVLYWHDDRTLAETHDAKWAEIRAKREALLSESDWRSIRAADQGGQAAASWATSPWRDYRQALRNVTDQGDPFSITWPTPPAE